MFAAMAKQGFGKSLVREGPSVTAAIVIAEVFYKFHSFALECIAFLATWCVLSAIQHFVTRRGVQ